MQTQFSSFHMEKTDGNIHVWTERKTRKTVKSCWEEKKRKTKVPRKGEPGEQTHRGGTATIFPSSLAVQPEVRASGGLLFLTGQHCQS